MYRSFQYADSEWIRMPHGCHMPRCGYLPTSSTQLHPTSFSPLTAESNHLIKILWNVYEANNWSCIISNLASTSLDLTALLWPVPQEELSLSTSSFEVETRSDQEHLRPLDEVHFEWGEANENTSCWHGLFKGTSVILNAPIKDRIEFAQPRMFNSDMDLDYPESHTDPD